MNIGSDFVHFRLHLVHFRLLLASSRGICCFLFALMVPPGPPGTSLGALRGPLEVPGITFEVPGVSFWEALGLFWVPIEGVFVALFGD